MESDGSETASYHHRIAWNCAEAEALHLFAIDLSGKYLALIFIIRILDPN
jgi:hypothetical protein